MINYSINETWVKSISLDEFLTAQAADTGNPYSETDLKGIWNSCNPGATQAAVKKPAPAKNQNDSTGNTPA